MSADSMSTLKRALAILDLFSLATPVLTAEEIISKLSYSAPTGYRYILVGGQVMVQNGKITPNAFPGMGIRRGDK